MKPQKRKSSSTSSSSTSAWGDYHDDELPDLSIEEPRFDASTMSDECSGGDISIEILSPPPPRRRRRFIPEDQMVKPDCVKREGTVHPLIPDPNHPPTTSKTTDELLHKKIGMVLAILPDVDPAFVAQTLKRYKQNDVENACNYLLENDYPKIQEKATREASVLQVKPSTGKASKKRPSATQSRPPPPKTEEEINMVDVTNKITKENAQTTKNAPPTFVPPEGMLSPNDPREMRKVELVIKKAMEEELQVEENLRDLGNCLLAPSRMYLPGGLFGPPPASCCSSSAPAPASCSSSAPAPASCSSSAPAPASCSSSAPAPASSQSQEKTFEAPPARRPPPPAPRPPPPAPRPPPRVQAYFTREYRNKIRQSIKQESEESAVIELTDVNFGELVLQSDDIWLVEFFSPWCGHCKNLAPHWEQAAKELKGKVKLGALDGTVHTVMKNKYRVGGFPTIRMFGSGRKDGKASQYDGGRTATGIVSWALDKLAENIPAPEIVQEQRKKIITKEREIILQKRRERKKAKREEKNRQQKQEEEEEAAKMAKKTKTK